MEITLKEEAKDQDQVKVKDRQTICLNMIVKNEAHIIKQSLEKLIAKVKFDYWVISDTGSTDKTAEIIVQFFKDRNILGELHHDEWKNFGHNRTVALEYAFKKTDYLLVFDADDEIVGNFGYPAVLDQDAYKLVFGNAHTYTYERPLLINNQLRWKYSGILHEFLDPSVCGKQITMQTICGDYTIISGRTGSRSSDPEKYLKDAIVLEKAYADEVASKGPLQDRYAFYCANSFFDYGKFDKAAEWYKIVLTQKGWDQEKFISCFKLYKCYKRLQQLEQSHHYLIKSFYYDKERPECIYKLVVHYCCDGQPIIAYNYYSLIKEYYENKYILDNTVNKLFVDNRVANFYLPYYSIIISEQTKHYESGIKMFQIIFLKKVEAISQQHIGNMLFNFKFFIHFLNEINKDVPKFVEHIYDLFNQYIDFLLSRNYDLKQYQYFSEYRSFLTDSNKLRLLPASSDTSPKTDVNPVQVFSKDDCKKSKNILFFAGFCDKEWNYTFGLNNALGGSERAVNYIASSLPKDYNIFVSGNVKEEVVGNVHYIHLFKLNEIFKRMCFHTVIVSRYVSFYEMFQTVSTYQSYIWAHDTTFINYGCNMPVQQLFEKWNSKIDGAICLTKWHTNHIMNQFPVLKGKLHTINNGIVPSLFTDTTTIATTETSPLEKVKNLFVYTSCPERGLKRLLDLWPKILVVLPDAQLKIAAYNKFPSNADDKKMQAIIQEFSTSIQHCGQLKPTELYKLMGQAEYWLYPSYWPETSCITALEMLYSGVICLYYPCAGLTDTMDSHGFKIKHGDEVDVLTQVINLSKEERDKLIVAGREYTAACSWDNRADAWNNILFSEDKPTVIELSE